MNVEFGLVCSSCGKPASPEGTPSVCEDCGKPLLLRAEERSGELSDVVPIEELSIGLTIRELLAFQDADE